MSEIQSLARGLKILALLADAPSGGSITEAAEELGIDKARDRVLMDMADRQKLEAA